MRSELWCGGQGEPVISKFSILRRTVTSVFRNSEELLHCLFVFVDLPRVAFLHKAFDGLVRHTLRNERLLIELHAKPIDLRSARSLRAALFFFFFFVFEACFAITVETPSPQTHVLRFASFCELLRRPLISIKAI